MEVARTLEDPFELGDIYAVRAWAEFHIGRYGEAFRVADEGTRRAREAPGTEIHCLTWRTAARCRLGDWAGTIADAELAETLMGERIETPPGFTRRMFAAAAFVHDAQGNTQAADRYLTQILSLGEKEWGGLYGAIAWVGLILARRGSFEEADRVLEERDQAGLLQRLSIVLEARCDLVAERGSWDEAPGLLERARAHAEVGGLVALPAFADRLEGRASLAGGEAEAAASVLERAGDVFDRLGARWERAVTDLSLADALTARGDVGGARSVLSRSLPVLEELRSAREIDAARGRLSRLG
jgi:tetratricopeptide (TPR) repeat protein